MADEPTPGELARRMDVFVADFRDDVRELNRRVDGRVSADVYAAELTAVRDTLGLIRQALADAERAREEERRRAEDQRRADRRLIWSTLIAPVVVGLLVAYLLAQGLFS